MSRPVYLYLFDRNVETVRRAASVRDVNAMGEDWLASAISHSEPEMTGEAERDAVKITLPLSDPFADGLLRKRPEGVWLVTIYRLDLSDDSIEFEWAGRLVSPEVSGGEVSLRCEPSNTGLKQTIRPRVFMRSCPHTVYFGECRLNRNLFLVEVALIATDGLEVEYDSGGAADLMILGGGFLQTPSGEMRRIKTPTDASHLTLERRLPSLVTLLTEPFPVVYLLPGCDRSMARCQQFPNAENLSGTNIENHGAFPWMLSGGNNPFGGGSAL